MGVRVSCVTASAARELIGACSLPWWVEETVVVRMAPGQAYVNRMQGMVALGCLGVYGDRVKSRVVDTALYTLCAGIVVGMALHENPALRQVTINASWAIGLFLAIIATPARWATQARHEAFRKTAEKIDNFNYRFFYRGHHRHA